MLSLLSDLFIFSPKAGGQTVDQTDLGDDEEEEEEEEEEDTGPPQIDPATGQPIPKPKKKKKRVGKRKFRGKLSNKPQDFQVGLTHCMLGNFSCFCCRLLTFFQNKIFQNIL